METFGGFKSGFVSIIGKPNAGKSTLMNAMVGRKLAITTPKAQTTRHRILGIAHGEGYQIVFSDTPGVILPQYRLHRSMMASVNQSLEDADLIVLSGDPLSIYTKVESTWVEGKQVFDRNDPQDLLYAVGGYGAGHDQQPYFCCFDQASQN